MSKTLKNFYDALQRLIDEKPKVITGTYSINNDTVALEAGRKRGAIKKSRPELAELLEDIVKAEACRTGKVKATTVDIRDSKLQEVQKKIKELERINNNFLKSQPDHIVILPNLCPISHLSHLTSHIN